MALAKQSNKQPFLYKDIFLVGIGTSAGGLEALQFLLDNYLPQSNMSFVIVQHLSPDYKSQMAELLSKHTDMKVQQIKTGVEIKPNHVYVMPERKNLLLKDGKLILTEKDPLLSINFPIDIFFHSLGVEKREKAIGIILSGTGTDGSRGIKTIKEHGGIIMVQEPRTAKFSGMPVSAISTQLADFVLEPQEITAELNNIAQHKPSGDAILLANNISSSESLIRILKLVHKGTGIDFSFYKRNTMYRRIERRMHLCKSLTLTEYYTYLNTNPDEVLSLQKDLLIGVTQFFRDQEAFESLENEVITQIFKNKSDGEPIRIWTPGCSTGEEAYSLLILLEEFKEKHNRTNPIKIFATDIDIYALEVAGLGKYPVNIATDVTKTRLQRFFIHEDQSYQIIPELRNQIVFARHNIFNDPPFHRVDLIVCRNLLIYLGNILQKKVFSLFQFAINVDGFLFLGPSESLGEYESRWKKLDSKWKIYRYAGSGKPKVTEIFSSSFPEIHVPISIPSNPNNPTQGGNQNVNYINIFKEILAENFSPMCAFINLQMDALYISGGINRYMNLPERDMRLNIMNMLPQELIIPLSTAVQKIGKKDAPIRYNSIKLILENGSSQYMDLKVERITHKRLVQTILMVTLYKQEKSKIHEPLDVEVLNVDEMAYERIQFLEQQLLDTRESLQLSVEEKETSNEELQASTEELQASNEELMAANEELQSTNQELQSVNEELHALNSELQSKIMELTELSSDMENFLNSTEIGTIFLDSRLCLRKFTPTVSVHLQLFHEDIGRPIGHFNTSLGEEDLAELATDVMRNQIIIEKRIIGPNKLPFILRILPYKTKKRNKDGVVIAFIPSFPTLEKRSSSKRIE